MNEQTFAELINNINDKIFKTTFQYKATAVEYLQVFLSDVAEQLDLEALTLKDTNFLDEGLEEYFSDVVYETYLKPTPTTRFKNAVRVVLLFEHKKGIDTYFDLFLQILIYIVSIWKQDRQEKRSPTLVLPLIVNQSLRKIKDKTLHDAIKGIPKNLLKYIPQFSAHIVNVHSEDPKKLLALDEKGILRGLFLSYIAVEDKEKINAALKEIFKFIVEQPHLLSYFEKLFLFLTQEGYFEQNEIKEMLQEYLSENKKRGLLTTAEMWIKEGEILGEARGEARGDYRRMRLTILRGLFHKVKIATLGNLTELDTAEIVQLRQDYRRVLAAWRKQKVDVGQLVNKTRLLNEEIQYLLKLFGTQQ
jgi:hypothetical protein